MPLKLKIKYICIAPYLGKPTSKALRCGSNRFYTAKVHHICLYRVVRQNGWTVVSWWSLLLVLINRPYEDERLSWPFWLTYNGRLSPSSINWYRHTLGAPRVTVAPCSCSCSFSWCLAEGYGNGDQRRRMGPCGSGRRTLAFNSQNGGAIYFYFYFLI